jgi:ATP-binding cassette, subfamily C, bacterial
VLAAIRLLLKTLWKVHPRQTLVVVGLTLLNSLFVGAGIGLLVPVLSSLNSGSTQAGNAAIGEFSKFASLFGFAPTLSFFLVANLLVGAIQALLQDIQAQRAQNLGENFGLALQTRFFRALEKVRWEVLATARSSDLLHNATSDLRRVVSLMMTIPTFFSSLILLAVYALTCSLLSPSMTLASISLGGVVTLLLKKNSQRAYRAGSDLGNRWKASLGDLDLFIEGFKTARCYGADARLTENLLQGAREICEVRRDSLKHHLRGQMVFRVVSLIMLTLVVYTSVYHLNISPSRLLVFLYVFSRMIGLFSQLESQFTRLAADLPALAETERVVLSLEAEQEESSANPAETAVPRQRIDLVNISYRHRQGAQRGVEGLNLSLPVGQTVLLGGPSGSGKSTTIDLMLGLLQPDSGTLALDEKPLLSEQLASWRAQIGYVAQDTFLLPGSIRANLEWSKPNATEDEMWQSLRMASAEQFVRQLPEGLDTHLGDRGAKLSGGERQRLGLARAFLRSPSLLVLDEPTSSLDSESEQLILQSLQALKGKVTIFLVTHRQTTAAIADVVYDIENGICSRQEKPP